MAFRRLVQSSDQLFPYHHPAQGRQRKIGLADGGVTTAAALEDFHRVDLPGRWQRNEPCQQLPGSFRQRQCAPGGIGRQDAGGLPVQGQGDLLRGNAGAYHPEGRGQCHRPGTFDPYMHGLWSPGCLSACGGLIPSLRWHLRRAGRAPPAAYGWGVPQETHLCVGWVFVWMGLQAASSRSSSASRSGVPMSNQRPVWRVPSAWPVSMASSSSGRRGARMPSAMWLNMAGENTPMPA